MKGMYFRVSFLFFMLSCFAQHCFAQSYYPIVGLSLSAQVIKANKIKFREDYIYNYTNGKLSVLANNDLVGNLSTESLIDFLKEQNQDLNLDENILKESYLMANSVFPTV